MPPPRLERAVLLAPDALARRAARMADDLEARWMLVQPRAIRRSYVAEVIDRGGDAELREQIWLLRQAPETRESFVREVLTPQLRAVGAPGPPGR